MFRGCWMTDASPMLRRMTSLGPIGMFCFSRVCLVQEGCLTLTVRSDWDGTRGIHTWWTRLRGHGVFRVH